MALAAQPDPVWPLYDSYSAYRDVNSLRAEGHSTADQFRGHIIAAFCEAVRMSPVRKPEDDWLDDLWRLSVPWIATAFFLTLFVIVPLGSLGFMAFGFLKTGQWVVIDIRSFTSWSPETDWIGFNQVAEWVLDLWVGWPALATGALSVWVYTNSESI